MREYTPLTDIQWEKLKGLFPAPQKRGRGKPHSPWKAVLNSILFVLLCHAKWGSWPESPEFASKSASHRWYIEWDKTGKLEEIIAAVKDVYPEAGIYLPSRRTCAIREVESEEPACESSFYPILPTDAAFPRPTVG